MVMQTNQVYPTDLTDSQWDLIREMIPKAKPGGHPRTLEMREVINAILYLVVGGIQWRMLPKEYPKWQSVYTYFGDWRRSGLWKRIHDTLRARVREKAGRHKHPTAGCMDSQSVKMTLVPGLRGYDAGKHVTGRKRHILAVFVRIYARFGQMEPIVVNYCFGLLLVSGFELSQFCARKDKRDFRSCPDAGLLNALSPGWMPIAV